MTATKGFGPTLKRLRLAAGLTQEALAERAGVSSRAVSDLERDPHRTPRLDTVGLLADALGLAPDQRAELLAAARPAGPAGQVAPEHGLPRPLTPLIGRAGVAAALVDLLERGETRLLTLTGPGGVGKTRLALEVATRMTARYADGAVFVDLAPLREPNLVLPAVAHRFGLDGRDPTPLPERLTAVLRAKEVLVLLDNVEHLLEARMDVLDLLTACPGVTALLTSRVPLRVRGEREYRIAPLELPGATGAPIASAAGALLADRAGAVGAELTPGDAPAVAEICRQLDGLPLAIELAAARLRVLSPSALAARLVQRLPTLVGGPHDLPDRQRTMRDAIAWSYQLLSEPARTLFRTLSVFVGGCAPPAAESISASPSFWDTMAELVDANLVNVRRRVTMLETIREYGLECLHAAGEAEDAAGAHAGYFVAYAERGDPVSAEHANLLAALDWALACGAAEPALRLCGALWRFWVDRGHLAEGRRLIGSALALPAAGQVPAPARLAALLGAAKMAIEQSAYAEAETWCARLVELARQVGTDHDLVAALNTRGHLARLQDRYADAVNDHREAVALAEACADHAGHAAALIGLSYDTFFTGDSALADELAERGLAATRAAGSRRELADALLLIAWQDLHAGKHESTHALATESVEMYRALKDTGKVAEGLRIVGTNAQMRGQYNRATAAFEESEALYRQRGDEHTADQLLAHLSHAAMSIGDLARARTLGEQALASARRYANQWSIAMSTVQLGHVELAAGRIERARALFRESAAGFQAIGNLLYMSWCLEGLAGIAVADTSFELAARLCAARDELLTRLAAKLPPMNPPGYEGVVNTVDSALGTAGVAAARAAVADLPLADLITSLRAGEGA